MTELEFEEISIVMRHPVRSWVKATFNIFVQGREQREKVLEFKRYAEDIDFPFRQEFWQRADQGNIRPKPIFTFIGARPYDLMLATGFHSENRGLGYLEKHFWPRLIQHPTSRRFSASALEADGEEASDLAHGWISRVVGAHMDLSPQDFAVCFVPTEIEPWVMTGELGSLKYLPLQLDEILAHEWSHLVCPPSPEFISLSKLPYNCEKLARRYNLPQNTMFLSETTFEGPDQHETQSEAKTVAMVNAFYRLPIADQFGELRYPRTIYNNLVEADVDAQDPQQLSLALIDSFVNDLPSEAKATRDFLPTRNQGNGTYFIRPDGTVGRLSDVRTRQYRHRWDSNKGKFVLLNHNDAQSLMLQGVAVAGLLGLVALVIFTGLS